MATAAMPTTTATATPGIFGQNRRRTRITTMPASPTASAARFTCPSATPGRSPDLGEQPPALDREAAQPRELPDQDGDGDPVQVAELHRPRQQLGHEAQPGDAGDQDDQPGDDGEGARQDDRGLGVVAAQGQDHGRDHRRQRRVGPSTMTRDGPRMA